MPLIQRKAKLNDFLVGTATGHRKPRPHSAVSTALCTTHSKLGSYLSDMGIGATNHVYAYQAEKVRTKKKTTVVLFKSGPSKGQVKSKNVEIVRQGGWKLRMFKFPADRVKSIVQHARHFTLVLK